MTQEWPRGAPGLPGLFPARPLSQTSGRPRVRRPGAVATRMRYAVRRRPRSAGSVRQADLGASASTPSGSLRWSTVIDE
ncbi:hypothetical protein [Streptomyces sp. NPDC001851]|uniref:hypothetical protein n=1 Tax=Streptomyces sp. NPDC001851 TaxID=3154529 RepID=UPI003327CABF